MIKIIDLGGRYLKNKKEIVKLITLQSYFVLNV